MAMTQGRGTLVSHPQPVVDHVYRSAHDDFCPKTEWKEDEESNSPLLIYLPGFLILF